MKCKLILLIILFQSGAGFHAISQVPAASYFHLTGSADQTTPVTLDLVKIGDSLYGGLTFGKSSNRQDLTGTANLHGKWGANQSVKMTGFIGEAELALAGSLSGEMKFIASLKSEKGINMTLNLTERYQPGSVEFLLYHGISKQRLVKKQGSPRATLSYAVMVPAESGNPILSDTLRRIVQNCFFGNNDKEQDTDTLIARMKSVFFDAYQSDNVSLFETMPKGPNFNWEKLKFMHIIQNQDYLLTFYILNYGFTGGAHGLETMDFYSVDLKQGRLIKLSDLFKPGYEEALSTILSGKLRQKNGLNDSQLLQEAGYFVEKVKPNENFYVLPSGIGFLFNQYEIAPYSFGATDIFLPYSELREILK